MKNQILFTGYAPVHFLCFKPIYDRLVERDDVDVFVSGGMRQKVGDGYVYDGPAMYEPLGVPKDRVLPVEAIQDRPFDLLFSANKRIIAPVENFGIKIQMFHGVSFRNRAVRPENLVYDYFFLVGPYMRRKFGETGLMEESDPRAVSIGFPKTDPLVGHKPDDRKVLARYGFTGKRPVVLYAPTGEAHNSLETMGEAVIRHLSETNRYDLLIKPHDHPKNNGIDWFARLSPLQNEHTRLAREADVVPLLLASDLLITDASSVANEYTLLDRPIVFLDVPELLQLTQAKGAALDLQTWGRKGGIVAASPEEVVGAVDAGLAGSERLSAIRQAIAEDLFYHPGHATEAAMAWINEQLRPPRRIAV